MHFFVGPAYCTLYVSENDKHIVSPIISLVTHERIIQNWIKRALSLFSNFIPWPLKALQLKIQLQLKETKDVC